MPQFLGWLKDPSHIVSCVKNLMPQANVSVVLPLSHQPQEEIVVLGPLSHDFTCYPFLDFSRHLRRLGLDAANARRATRALSRGRALIYLDGQRSPKWEDLARYPFQDLLMIP
ncbi:MAG: hypothetical protein OWS74_00025 [Firmicutes bacterium]|nr:hypothetical protein [Bacillota bacterium]